MPARFVAFATRRAGSSPDARRREDRAAAHTSAKPPVEPWHPMITSQKDLVLRRTVSSDSRVSREPAVATGSWCSLLSWRPSSTPQVGPSHFRTP